MATHPYRHARRRSDDTARIVETPFAIAVTIVLGELEATVSDLRKEFKAGRPVTLDPQGIARRGTRNAHRNRSLRRLGSGAANSRRSAATFPICSSPRSTRHPASVRRLLRPPPAKDIRAGSTVDCIEVDEVEARVEFVNACRNYAGELALSEVTLRAYSELTQYLETGTKILLDALRHAEACRPPVPAVAGRRRDPLVPDRCSATNMPELLAKAADVAVQSATTEKESPSARDAVRNCRAEVPIAAAVAP